VEVVSRNKSWLSFVAFSLLMLSAGLTQLKLYKMLQDKGYVYDQHVLPHGVRVRELGSGKSRVEMLEELGIHNIEIAPQLLIDDGIQQVRTMLNKLQELT
jgi:hypothetical protein